MAQGQTGKQRAKGVPLDYFKRVGPLDRWKRRLTLAAAVAAVAWWASGLELSGVGWPVRESARGRLRASRGPVTRVHATWEANCNACHVSFVPITGEHWSAGLLPVSSAPRGGSDAGTGNPSSITSASDARCMGCHAGPPHHENEASIAGLTCAGCHREHRGREASLVRLADASCTQCHGHLSAHTKSGMPAQGYRDVTSFVNDHPEFRWAGAAAEANDPGQVEFNHALHMASGLVRQPGDVPFTLARLADPAARDRYRRAGQSDSDAVQLECTTCHRTDGGDLEPTTDRAARRPRRAAGSYMLPIVYENQCRACHPLDIEAAAVARAPGGKPVTIPHGVQPDELHDTLERAFVGRYVSGQPGLLEEPAQAAASAPASRLPVTSASQEARKARGSIDDQVYLAEKILYLGKQTCSECHRYETPGGRPAAASIGRGERPSLRVKPAAIKEVWYEHATFDHTAHRALGCRECHARAYSQGQKGHGDSITSRDILLPGIATCRACHTNPAPDAVGGSLAAGASAECTECHRYHNGDAPLQGLGAGRRGALREHGIAEFLTSPHGSSARGSPP